MGESSSDVFTLWTWNVNGLLPILPNLQLSTYKSLGGFFKHHGLDAVCFQEMKTPEAKITQQMACVPGYESFWAVSRDRLGYSGVTSYLRAPPYCPQDAWVDDVGVATGSGADLDREGRLVITDLGPFILANVYVPNAGDRTQDERLDFKCRFLESLKTRLCQFLHKGKEVIVVGDFNVPAERRDMHATYNYQSIYTQREVQAFHSFLSEFVDIWRHLHPDAEDCYTMWQERTNARVFNAGSRIDYILVSRGLLDHVISCEIINDIPPKWSDHAPVSLKLKGIQGLGPRPPCASSSKRMKQFNQGRNIRDMFNATAAANKRPRKDQVQEPQQQQQVDKQQQQQKQEEDQTDTVQGTSRQLSDTILVTEYPEMQSCVGSQDQVGTAANPPGVSVPAFGEGTTTTAGGGGDGGDRQSVQQVAQTDFLTVPSEGAQACEQAAGTSTTKQRGGGGESGAGRGGMGATMRGRGRGSSSSTGVSANQPSILSFLKKK